MSTKVLCASNLDDISRSQGTPGQPGEKSRRAVLIDLTHLLHGIEDGALLENKDWGICCSLRYQPSRIYKSLKLRKKPIFAAHRSTSFESERSIAGPQWLKAWPYILTQCCRLGTCSVKAN